MFFKALPFLLSLTFGAQATPFRVLIDPGHGGIDTGAVVGKAKESEISLQVAKALQSRLNENPQFHARLTRERDQHLSLQERVKKTEELKPDLFLSIHANSSPDPRAKGVEFYFQNQLPPDEESLFLASHENQIEKDDPFPADAKKNESDLHAILDDLKRQHRLQQSFTLSRILADTWQVQQKIASHTIRQAPFYVITKSTRPSVLVEVGYLTHASEASKLMQPAEQRKLAELIYQGLLKYREAHLVRRL